MLHVETDAARLPAILLCICRWVAPPVFPDAEKTRAAALLNTILLAGIGFWLSALILLITCRVAHWTNVPVALGANALLLGLLVLLRRGHVRLAEILSIGVTWGAATVFIYSQGSVYSVHLFGYLIVTILAAWMGGPLAGAASWLLSIGSIIALAQAGAAGLLPPSVRAPTLNLALNVSGYLGFSIVVLSIARAHSSMLLRLAHAEIVERTATQIALRRSEAGLKAAELIAHMGSWERDLTTNELSVSEGLYHLLGFSPEMPPQVAYAATWNAVHPDDVVAAKAAFVRATAAGAPLHITFRIGRPTGEMRVFDVTANVLCDAAGQPVRLRGTAHDITEREQVRVTLDQRIQELSMLQDLGHLVSLNVPLEETIRIYLQRLVTFARFDMVQVFLLREGRLRRAGVCTDLPAPTSQAQILAVGECLCGRVAQDGQPLYAADVECDPRCTLSHCHVNGLHSLAAFPLRGGETIIGVLAVGAVAQDAFADRLSFLETIADQIAVRLHNALLHQEIHARATGLGEMVAKRTRELQAERDYTQAILETVDEAVIVTDLDGRILFANPAASTLTGFSKDHLLGQPLWQGWTAQSLRETWPEWERALSSGAAWRGEITGRRKDGVLYTAMLTGAPFGDDGASRLPVGAVWALRDITSIKEAERLKDQFVSNVSHELRTPTSIITLSCDNLETYHDRLNESQRGQLLQDIHEQAHLLSRLVEDILTFSRIDSGRVEQTRSRVDLAHLVREEVTRQQPLAEKRSQHLACTAATPVAVLGNEGQLRQMLRNLLDNAIKYTLDGGQIYCSCEVRAGAGGGMPDAGPSLVESWAVVEVSDNGIGIDARDIPIIFERFHRVRSEGDVPGTGLGLAIAQELTQLHGGRITVASSPGRGSTFTVYLPLEGQETGSRSQDPET